MPAQKAPFPPSLCPSCLWPGHCRVSKLLMAGLGLWLSVPVQLESHLRVRRLRREPPVSIPRDLTEFPFGKLVARGTGEAGGKRYFESRWKAEV